MESILRKLYYGNINPHKEKFEEDAIYQKAAETLIENEAKLMETLPKSHLSMFIAYVDAKAEVADTTALEKFSYGFKLGILLGMELFPSEEDI